MHPALERLRAWAYLAFLVASRFLQRLRAETLSRVWDTLTGGDGTPAAHQEGGGSRGQHPQQQQRLRLPNGAKALLIFLLGIHVARLLSPGGPRYSYQQSTSAVACNPPELNTCSLQYCLPCPATQVCR